MEMLNDSQKLYVEQRVMNESKSAGVAYSLALFFTGLGIHRFYLGEAKGGSYRFYLGKSEGGLYMMGITFFGFFCALVSLGVALESGGPPGPPELNALSYIGIASIIVATVWWISDIFLIHKMIEDNKEAIRRKIIEEITSKTNNNGRS